MDKNSQGWPALLTQLFFGSLETVVKFAVLRDTTVLARVNSAGNLKSVIHLFMYFEHVLLIILKLH